VRRTQDPQLSTFSSYSRQASEPNFTEESKQTAVMGRHASEHTAQIFVCDILNTAAQQQRLEKATTNSTSS